MWGKKRENCREVNHRLTFNEVLPAITGSRTFTGSNRFAGNVSKGGVHPIAQLRGGVNGRLTRRVFIINL